MSKIGTAATMERIDYIDQPGSGEQSPGLVFRVSGHRFSRIVEQAVTFLTHLPECFAWPANVLRRAFIRTTELQIDAQGLTASGDLGSPRAGTLHLPWSRIHELHYAPGDRGEIGGLYAREGTWCSRCILPRITEPQADQVIAAIAAQYPAPALGCHGMSHLLPPRTATGIWIRPAQDGSSAGPPTNSTRDSLGLLLNQL